MELYVPAQVVEFGVCVHGKDISGVLGWVDGSVIVKPGDFWLGLAHQPTLEDDLGTLLRLTDHRTLRERRLDRLRSGGGSLQAKRIMLALL